MLPIIGVAAFGVTPAWADNIRWGRINGGSFGVGSNWVGGVVPDTDDSARFGITTNPLAQAIYTVSFNSSPTTGSAVIEDDRVTFDLNGNGYLLTDPNFAMAVGTESNRSGSLRITNGIIAATESTTRVHVGASSNASGFLTVSTGAQFIGPNFFVGYIGPGSLVVENGGDVIGGQMTLGSSSGAGTATVVGAGSSLAVEELFIADFVPGTLNVSAGGRVESAETQLGLQGNALGTVSIDGANSRWESSDDVHVGYTGRGALNITGGGRVECVTATAGFLELSSGIITVNGNSQLIAQDRCLVGNQGAGTMNVTGGGVVQSSAGQIGVTAPGMVTVDGPGSRWTCSEEMVVGFGTSTGVLNITGGGEVRSADGVLGRFSSIGTVNLSGSGSSWTITDDLSVGGDAGAGQAGRIGTITIAAGGTVTARNVYLFAQGTLELAGGTLNAGQVARRLSSDGALVFSSGVLHAGIVAFGLDNHGGTLAPGQSAGSTPSPGATVISAQYTQRAGASMEIEIGGTDAGSQFDQIFVGGVASLDGTLRLSLINGFTPSAGQTFVVLETSSITGAFANVANGARLAVAGGGGSFIVNYGAGSAFNPTRVVLSGFTGCASDFNGDGVVNSTDVSDFINAWFSDLVKGTLVTDFDHNGVVNSTDVSAFINQWFADQAACGG